MASERIVTLRERHRSLETLDAAAMRDEEAALKAHGAAERDETLENDVLTLISRRKALHEEMAALLAGRSMLHIDNAETLMDLNGLLNQIVTIRNTLVTALRRALSKKKPE